MKVSVPQRTVKLTSSPKWPVESEYHKNEKVKRFHRGEDGQRGHSLVGPTWLLLVSSPAHASKTDLPFPQRHLSFPLGPYNR